MTGGLRPFAFVICLALPWAESARAQPQPGPRGPVVDRVVALVDGTLISQLDLELEASVLLVQRGAGPVAPDEQLLSYVLGLAINERLLTRDADKLQVFPVEEGTLDAKLREFESRFEGRPDFERFLARFEATRTMLREIFKRKIRADKILENKFRLRSQVGEEEVRQHYEGHAAELGPDYEAVHQALRDKLTAERFTRLVSAEVVQLRRKASIRLVAPFATRMSKEAP